jgi:hypothetical protein
VNQLSASTLLSLRAIIDSVARIFVYALTVLDVLYTILLFSHRRTMAELSSLPPERRRSLHASALLMVKVIRLALFALPVGLVPAAIIMHLILGANLTWLFAFFGLLMIGLVEVLVGQNQLANGSADKPASQETGAAA